METPIGSGSRVALIKHLLMPMIGALLGGTRVIDIHLRLVLHCTRTPGKPSRSLELQLTAQTASARPERNLKRF